MKKTLLLTSIFVVFLFSSCGVIFPQIASITVKNNSSDSAATIATTISNAYIARASQPISDSAQSIESGKEFKFSATWWGGMTDLSLMAYVNGVPTELKNIQGVANGNDITVTLTDAVNAITALGTVPVFTNIKVEKKE